MTKDGIIDAHVFRPAAISSSLCSNPGVSGSRESSRSDLAHCSLGARRSIPKKPAC
jgi:hypothetical protein